MQARRLVLSTEVNKTLLVLFSEVVFTPALWLLVTALRISAVDHGVHPWVGTLHFLLSAALFLDGVDPELSFLPVFCDKGRVPIMQRKHQLLDPPFELWMGEVLNVMFQLRPPRMLFGIASVLRFGGSRSSARNLRSGRR